MKNWLLGRGCCAVSDLAGWTASSWDGQHFVKVGRPGSFAIVHAYGPWEALIVWLHPSLQIRSSEKLLPIPLFCIVATAVVWAAALYFFFQTLSSWEVMFPFCYPSVRVCLPFPLFFFFCKNNTVGESLGLPSQIRKGVQEAVLRLK